MTRQQDENRLPRLPGIRMGGQQAFASGRAAGVVSFGDQRACLR